MRAIYVVLIGAMMTVVSNAQTIPPSHPAVAPPPPAREAALMEKLTEEINSEMQYREAIVVAERRIQGLESENAELKAKVGPVK